MNLKDQGRRSGDAERISWRWSAFAICQMANARRIHIRRSVASHIVIRISPVIILHILDLCASHAGERRRRHVAGPVC